MKNKRSKIFGIILWIILLSWIVYATYEKDRKVDNHVYYKINNGNTLNVDRWVKCRKVKNSSGVSYFIPIKTNNEWYNFVNHKPSGTTITNECYISKWYDKWTSFWRRGPWSEFEVCYHWKCVDWNTAWESASIYRYWKTDWTAYEEEVPNWKVKRWSHHHNSDGSHYYYVTIKE